MDLNNVTYTTDDYYRLITIQEARDTLIYIILSYSLTRKLNNQ